MKIDLFPDEVYVFTPKGEILELPRGACPIDFAYTIHTDVGNHCVACRIDRRLAPLSAPLESGQTVEIITAEEARPSPDWLTFTVSSRARAAIRQALKEQQRSESVRLGRQLLDRSLANADTSIKALDFRRLRSVFRAFGVRKLDDLLAEIGLGNLMAYGVAQRLLAADNPAYEAVDIERGGPVAIRGGEGLVITYARCCGPIPGDHVVGHMTPGKGLVVHVETCNNLVELRRRQPREIIPSRWSSPTQGEFETTLDVAVNRRKGVVAELANAVNAADAGINNITWTSGRRSCRSSGSKCPYATRIISSGCGSDCSRWQPCSRRRDPARPSASSTRTEGTDVSRRAIKTETAPEAIGTYSQALAVAGTVYLSGQIPLDPATMEMVPGDTRRQVDQVLANLRAVAEAAGGDLDDIAKLTVYLTDLADFGTVNEAMAEAFSEPYPARAAVQVAALPRGARVEIDAVLVLDHA